MLTLVDMSNEVHEHIRPLKIFNASAGSGKTYHLVKEFIELLIGDANRPDAFWGLLR